MKETPLMIACKNGHEKLVSKLLEHGDDWKEKDFLGRSCKEIARRNGKSRVLQLLNVWKVSNY